MGFLSKFEGKMEDAFEGAAEKIIKIPLSPVQIAKKAEREMRREKLLGAGRQYAPTLYTVLVNAEDDARLFGYYPTLAGETETYLSAKAADDGLVLDGKPLVRFVVDDDLKRGKFDIIAELVASPVVEQLRAEEFERYGIGSASSDRKHVAPSQSPMVRAQRYQDAVVESIGAASGGQGTMIDEVYRGFDTYSNGNDYDKEEMPESQTTASVENTIVFANPSIVKTSNPNIPHAQLIDTKTRQICELSSMRMLIGRESTNDIVVRDANVSRTHAELRLERGSAWVLTDLGSTNGTFVNDHEISTHTLSNGDRITLGTTSFVFSLP